MFVVTRKKDQEIVIVTASGERILVKLLRCSPGAAKIGLEADEDIRFVRGEIIEETRLQLN